MGNVNCLRCNVNDDHNSNFDLISDTNDKERLESVIKIQNKVRSHNARKMLEEKKELYKKEIEQQLLSDELGTFISEEELKKHLNEIQNESTLSIQSHNKYQDEFKYSLELPPFKFKDGSIYSGHWNSNGKKEGYGVNIGANGSLYKGYWLNDKIHKYGTFYDGHGNKYKGALKNGLAEGEGELIVNSNVDSDNNNNNNDNNCNCTIRYKGNFKNDIQDGYGREENQEDNTVYEGEFKDGVKCGKGKLTYKDGTVYEGEFSDNVIHGKGIMKFANGREYEGEFKEGAMNGKGVFKWEDGCKYVGEYLNGQKHGHGVFYWNDNQYYDGMWMNGKQHGDGSYYLDAKKLSGHFRFGKIIVKKE